MSRFDGLSQTALQGVHAAAKALDAGNVDEASGHLAAVLATDSSHPEILRMVAGIRSMRGAHREAIEIMRLALAQRPDDAVYHNTLATLLGNAGEYDEAIEALQRTCNYQPGMALAWYNLGVMLTRSVRNDEAVVALQQAVMLDPDHMRARALLADMLRTQGEIEQAAIEYRKVIAQQPSAGMAWWGLADLRAKKFDATDIVTMQKALRDSASGDDDRIALGFALAKALDENALYRDSLAALAQANDVARRRQTWNRQGYSTAVRAVRDAFPSLSYGAPSTLGDEVIFIVGLPRSGSTLVEQILASHSKVAGAGELPDLPLVLAEESRQRGKPFPRWVGDMQPDDWKRLGNRYLERTSRWREHRPMFTDKLPSNWVYAGAISAMLPGARIVGCQRNALETCFSCYRQRMDNNEYTRNFDDLASFWSDCDASLRHWNVRHPDQVFLHSYERLLANPAEAIRQLLDFCGLGFEEACLNFYDNARDVRSPSATQVRRPLRDDTRHSERYGDLLDPLRAALRRYDAN